MLEVGKLSNEDLLGQLKGLLSRDAKLEAELLLFLGEVDARRLYLDEACSSMFVYCTRELGLSEACAYHRIGAARAARKFPVILTEVAAGRLHVSGVTLLAPHLVAESAEEWLAAARGKTKREIEFLIAERRPKPEAPSLVRKLPLRGSKAVHEVTAWRPEVSPQRGQPAAPKPEPLGEERYKVQFTADRELREKLAEAQDLLSHRIPPGDLAAVFGLGLDLLIKETKRRRFAETDRPRAQRERTDDATRHIPAALRREVFERDGGLCTFVGRGGKRCGARARLQFHHREPWARSREHSLENLALLCGAHNQYLADLEFGRGWMLARRAGRAPTLPGES